MVIHQWSELNFLLNKQNDRENKAKRLKKEKEMHWVFT